MVVVIGSTTMYRTIHRTSSTSFSCCSRFKLYQVMGLEVRWRELTERSSDVQNSRFRVGDVIIKIFCCHQTSTTKQKTRSNHRRRYDDPSHLHQQRVYLQKKAYLKFHSFWEASSTQIVSWEIWWNYLQDWPFWWPLLCHAASPERRWLELRLW